ncbi:MAG TPA: potassium-transporting ATPase subunit KdpA [Myxococcales bacterium]|nr:potassium-transporting ATPase subunit KdpA [Myxococcales bacterium]
MTAIGWVQILVFLAVVVAITKPLGKYMYRVFEGEPPFPKIGKFFLKLCGTDGAEQTWGAYAFSVLAFSMFGLLVTYLLMRVQGVLPFNPQKLGAVEQALSFNTAASFTTNTNWQSYTPETTMSYLTQMAGLAWHNFTSAAAGIGVALAFARGLTRQGRGKTLGNFWVDLIHASVYVLLPISFVYALFLVSQGALQNFDAYREITSLEGVKQVIAMGPVASQEAIKMLGTNGGGFFNANSAHPFENPTPLTNFAQVLSIFAIGAGLTWTYGAMAKDHRQGWALFAAMAVLFLAGVGTAYWAESHDNPALRGIAHVQQGAGNLEGKETRFGIPASALFATVTTDASCGAVNSMHDSYTPLGGLVPLANIQLGEIIFGGVGAGLYGILVYVVLTVFIAGLMVGRTPEYLGKKIEGREMKLAMLYVLVFPLIILSLTGWAAIAPYGTSSISNAGPHGLTQMLYAFSSGAGNNGSAFGGINANTRFWNLAMGADMLIGRFWMILPALAIGGAMVDKKVTPAGPGTFPTNGALFVALLIGVILIVGALTFFPVLSLGPLVEHFAANAGRLF